MNKDSSCCQKLAPCVLGILRIVVAVLFMCHGSQKLLGFPGNGHAVASPASLLGVAAILELCGGFLIFIGLFTRPVAFILCGEMAVAYFMAHAVYSWSPFQLSAVAPIHNHGELAVLYCFVFLYLSVAGAGKFSVDCFRKCSTTPVTPAAA